MAKAKQIETEEEMKAYIAKELKKLHKVWVDFVDRKETSTKTFGKVKERAYLSLTVYRNSIMYNNDTESSMYFTEYEEVKNEKSNRAE